MSSRLLIGDCLSQDWIVIFEKVAYIGGLEVGVNIGIGDR